MFMDYNGWVGLTMRNFANDLIEKGFPDIHELYQSEGY